MSKHTDPETGLNPDLKTRTETTHDTDHSTPPPAESTSVTEADQGRGWPIVWIVVTVLGVLFALWLLFF